MAFLKMYQKLVFFLSILIFCSNFTFNGNVFGTKLYEKNKSVTNKLNVKQYPFNYDTILLLLRSISSLYSSLDFYDSFKQDMDIDGLLGVRIMSDQLNITIDIMNRLGRHKPWNQIIVNSLVDLREQSEEVLTTSMSAVVSDDQNYFNGLNNFQNFFLI